MLVFRWCLIFSSWFFISTFAVDVNTSVSVPIETSSNVSSNSTTTTTTTSSTTTTSTSTTIAPTPAIEPTEASLLSCSEAYDEYKCLREKRKKHLEDPTYNPGPDSKFLVKGLSKCSDIMNIYSTPGTSANGILIMGCVLAFFVLLGNGIAFGYFFKWYQRPLSKKPTEEELEAVLDEDLPVMLINHAQRAGEFQFAAKVPKDTQTIMASDVNQSGSEQPSQMPSELMSVAAEKGDGALGGAPPPPNPGTPRRGNRGGRGGGRGKGRGKK